MVHTLGSRSLGNISTLLGFAFATSLISPTLSVAREVGEDTLVSQSAQRLEIPDDGYIAVPREGMQRSPAYRSSKQGFFAVQVNVDGSGQNIVGDAANEPSIAVDPTDPNKIAIGWRQFDTITSNFRQAGYGYTTDGGLTWTFPGVIEPGIFRSDPVLDSDSEGNFYYNSLTVSGSDFLCDVFKSTGGGDTWDAGTFAHGGDKQWMVIDKTGGDGNVYAYWTSGFSVCPPGFFTRSTDRGDSFENCIIVPGDPFWGTLAVGPDGELYVCGVGNDFVVAKSSNAQDSSQSVVWDFSTTVDLGGQIAAFGGIGSPNPSGLHGQVWVAVDHSTRRTRGNAYMLCSVRPDVGNDPLDVMFARSTDGGLTWSSPLRVNDDTSTAWQWFGTMSVAPSGRIDVTWLDTRDDPGGLNSSLYYSYSTNAGVTWSQNERLSNSFNPHVGWPQQNKMGDYFDMVSDETGAHLAWAGTFNGEQDVYYGRITTVVVATQEPEIPSKFSLSQNYPNPFNPSTTIQYSLPEKSHVTLVVYNVLGQELATIVNEEKEAGSYQVELEEGSLSSRRLPTGRATRRVVDDLSSGIYFYRLQAGGFVKTLKMILMR